MSAIVAKVVETAAIGPGLCVKKGTAENGVVISGAGEIGYGVSMNQSPIESVSVGDHVDVALQGTIAKIHLAATLAAGADVAPDAAGKAVAIGSTAANKYFRAAVLLESGAAGELVDCIVTSDYVTIPA